MRDRWAVRLAGVVPILLLLSALRSLGSLLPHPHSFPQSPPEAKASALLALLGHAAVQQASVALVLATLLATLHYTARRRAARRAVRIAVWNSALGNLAYFAFILGVAAVLPGCARPKEPASPSNGSYGYESVDDPLADAEASEAKLSTSCADVRCLPPRVCRLLSLANPSGVEHAHCLGPDDDLCKMDPKLCTDEACRTDPELCR